MLNRAASGAVEVKGETFAESGAFLSFLHFFFTFQGNDFSLL